MKTPEYIEGDKARDNFESGMKVLFKLPKEAVPAKKKARTKRAGKTTMRGASRDTGGKA